MTSDAVSYRGYRFPADVIAHAVWLYFRFGLSFRDVEDLLAQRGILVTYETIRQWCRTFGRAYAKRLRHRRGTLGDTWYVDELFVAINGRRQYLWRAVDQDGDLLDILVQSRRNRRAAVRFFRKILKNQGRLPRRLITDRLRTYPAAHRTVMPSVPHDTAQYANNRAEVAHQPTRQRERQMRRFKSRAHVQQFAGHCQFQPSVAELPHDQCRAELPGIPLSTPDHQPCRLALLQVRPQLSGRRGPPRRARHHRHLRDHPAVVPHVRDQLRSPTPPPARHSSAIPGTLTSSSYRSTAASSTCGEPSTRTATSSILLVQSRRNRQAAVRFFRKILKKEGRLPRRLITDKLRSYPAAHRTVMPSVTHCTDQYANRHCQLEWVKAGFAVTTSDPGVWSAGTRHRLPFHERTSAEQAVVT